IYRVLLKILKKFVCEKKIILNAIAQGNLHDLSIKTSIEKFNEYSENNNLNIYINLNLITSLNSTANVDNFGFMIETLLRNKKNKYDLYYFDYTYTPILGSYLLDLNDRIPNNLLKIFNSNVLLNECSIEDKLVGLPGYYAYSLFYSNEILLNKYNKTIPKTWNELVNTSKYILEQEKKLNNTDLIAYNGLFNDDEEGICSLYEFIYSCRESVNSPFPDLRSETAIKSLELIKYIKNEIASGIDILSI
ncbi:hypothetical protein U3516DRAFT_529780, partial [Neocallimastix sp. 'constans']